MAQGNTLSEEKPIFGGDARTHKNILSLGTVTVIEGFLMVLADYRSLDAVSFKYSYPKPPLTDGAEGPNCCVDRLLCFTLNFEFDVYL